MPLKNNPPVIAHISTTFNGQAGAASRLYKRLRALADHGYGITLIVGRDFHQDAAWDWTGIDVYQVQSLIKYVNPLKDLQALKGLVCLLRRIRPYAVHTHLAKAGMLGRLAAHVTGTPVILHTVHGPMFPKSFPFYRRLPYYFLERMMGRVTDFFIFVGSELREEYVRGGVCSRNKAMIVRTGRPDSEIDALENIDQDELTGLRRSLAKDDEFLVSCVGRVVEEKQQAHAILAIHQLRSMGIQARLVVVGEALLKEEREYVDTLKSLAVRLDLKESVLFTGHRQDVLNIMSASDAVLHTSKREGLSNVLVEAALAKKPIVSYEVSGAREVIRDGETGFIVKQGDIRNAAERLQRLAKNPEMAREMGIKAWQCVSEEYRESRMIRNKLDAYRKMLPYLPLRWTIHP